MLEICIPCWFCTQCDLLQRQFRSLLHDISINRHNVQLNNALLRISSQLGQERSQFCLGGFIAINNELLGKVSITISQSIRHSILSCNLSVVPIRNNELHCHLHTVSLVIFGKVRCCRRATNKR